MTRRIVCGLVLLALPTIPVEAARNRHYILLFFPARTNVSVERRLEP